MTKTQGQQLADSLRSNFRIGGRTRRYRGGLDMHDEMIEALANATNYPGYYTGKRHELFTAAHGVVLSWIKHVKGCRIDGTLAYRISRLTPYQFASLLGQMMDAGVTNCGEGERFFSEMARN